jgi:hypothetical protein
MRPLPDPIMFTSDQALAAGWTHSALKNAVRRGRLMRPRRGLYAPAASATPELAAIAAARAIPDAVVSHRSATLLHALPLLGPRPSLPELTVPPRGNMNHSSVHLYRAALRPEDVVLIGGTAVTSVPRSLIDLARHRSLNTAVAAIDAALHDRRTTAEELAGVLHFCWNWPRIRRAQRAVALADGRAESPLESISRLLMPRLGFPAPEPQKLIFDRYGLLLARVDFYWDEVGVAGEADGRGKYDDERPVYPEEKERQEILEDLGLVIVRWGWDQATKRQHVLRARLENGFERGRLRDRSGFPRLWTF